MLMMTIMILSSDVNRIPQAERAKVSPVLRFVGILFTFNIWESIYPSTAIFFRSSQYSDADNSGNRDVYDKVEDIKTGIILLGLDFILNYPSTFTLRTS